MIDPFTAGLVSGGIGLVGTYFQNEANSAQAQRMMNFQHDMSGSAHQREVHDLRAAGLNPMLSAMGSGASSPGGAMADQGNLADGLNQGMATAMAVRQQNKEMDQKDAQIANVQADTENKGVQTALIENQASSTALDVKTKMMTNRILQETAPAMIKKAIAEGDFARAKEIMQLINMGANSAGSLLGIPNLMNSLKKEGKDLSNTPTPGKW